MMKLGSSRTAYQLGGVGLQPKMSNAVVGSLPACAATICEVDIVPAVMKTATMLRPIATSYEIICAAERRPPSSGYVEPDAQPASTTPYTAIDEQASSTSTDTGTSVSCSAGRCPNMFTTPPNGITANAVNAVVAEMTGAMKYTVLSAVFGMISSLNGSLS